jgi:hypothetical protein
MLNGGLQVRSLVQVQGLIECPVELTEMPFDLRQVRLFLSRRRQSAGSIQPGAGLPDPRFDLLPG